MNDYANIVIYVMSLTHEGQLLVAFIDIPLVCINYMPKTFYFDINIMEKESHEMTQAIQDNKLRCGEQTSVFIFTL